MAKNFAKLYAAPNDASALEQKFFVKQETIRGILTAPAGTDFIYSNEGGGINYMQPFEPSPVRSGRHNTTGIRGKTETSWSLPSFFHIDTTLGAAAVAEIDPAARVLFESLLGTQTAPAGPKFTSVDPPDITFSLFMNADQFAHQAPGAFVENGNLQFPGEGQATVEFAGSAKTMYRIGIGKSVIDNNGGLTVTLGTGEGKRFKAGGMVMLVEADGVTRSADTPDGSPRTIASVAGDIVTLTGANLADADGSGVSLPVYLCYYEPETSTAINDPQTGLVGTVTVGTLVDQCVRSMSVNITNNHELYNFCYGEDGLSGPLFSPSGRLTVEVEYELNMNHVLLEHLNELEAFTAIDISLVLGAAAGRRLQLDTRVIPMIPEISIPAEGSIPVTFSGTAYQSAIDAGDEISLEWK